MHATDRDLSHRRAFIPLKSKAARLATVKITKSRQNVPQEKNRTRISGQQKLSFGFGKPWANEQPLEQVSGSESYDDKHGPSSAASSEPKRKETRKFQEKWKRFFDWSMIKWKSKCTAPCAEMRETATRCPFETNNFRTLERHKVVAEHILIVLSN